MLLVWDRSLEVGVVFIDCEHRQLVEYTNEFHEAMRQGTARYMLLETLERLYLYTQTHFSHEELTMTREGYPHAPSHLVQHRKLLARVNDVQSRYREGSAALTVEVSGFLRDWLVNHIQVTDQRFGQWLRARGQAAISF